MHNEPLAKAIYAARFANAPTRTFTPWEDLSPDAKEDWFRCAEAARDDSAHLLNESEKVYRVQEERIASLESRLAEAERGRDEARGANERDRCSVADAIKNYKHAYAAYSWLKEAGRGSYAWDDERYQLEFRVALEHFTKAIEPLYLIASDMTCCPETHEKALSARNAIPRLTAALDQAKEGMLDAERRLTACHGQMLLAHRFKGYSNGPAKEPIFELVEQDARDGASRVRATVAQIEAVLKEGGK